ncbi:MAG: DUF4416 family protein [Candidatus Omnitrophota bacterium]|nr:DUF4416 family protein [Candidatus Omnitrophota bacterium]
MGNIRTAGKVKLITGLISNDTELFDKAKLLLEKRFKNKIDFESTIIDFSYTDYYNKEMGINLKRKFLSFKKLVSLKNIEKMKLVSNKIEDKFSLNNKRAINIDPGYLDLAKLVLFSTKDYSHRMHVGNNIYAEVTLHFMGEKFNAWPWTYPDYRTDEYISIFNSIRERYKNEIKGNR